MLHISIGQQFSQWDESPELPFPKFFSKHSRHDYSLILHKNIATAVKGMSKNI